VAVGIVGRRHLPFPAWPLAIFTAALFLGFSLTNEEFKRAIHAKSKGLAGERRVGAVLAGLPEGWRAFHDVGLGGENADHVVEGPSGVFNLEVKYPSGRVVAQPNGPFVNGRRLDRIVRQAWRRAKKLEDPLGVEVQPVLVFVGNRVEGNRAGRLPVCPL